MWTPAKARSVLTYQFISVKIGSEVRCLSGEEVGVDLLSLARAAPLQERGHDGAVHVQPRAEVGERHAHLGGRPSSRTRDVQEAAEGRRDHVVPGAVSVRQQGGRLVDFR